MGDHFQAQNPSDEAGFYVISSGLQIHKQIRLMGLEEHLHGKNIASQ
jgi:hypothetical protein